MPTSGEARIRPTSTYNLRSRPLPKTRPANGRTTASGMPASSKNKENVPSSAAAGKSKKSQIPVAVKTMPSAKHKMADTKSSTGHRAKTRVRTVPDFAKLHKSWQQSFNKGKACSKKQCTQVQEFDLTKPGTTFNPRYYDASRASPASDDLGEEDGFQTDDDALQSILNAGLAPQPTQQHGRLTEAGCGIAGAALQKPTRQTLGVLPSAYQGRADNTMNRGTERHAPTVGRTNEQGQPKVRADPLEREQLRSTSKRKLSLADQQQGIDVQFEPDAGALASILNNTGAHFQRQAPATRQTIGVAMGLGRSQGSVLTGRQSQGPIRTSLYLQKPRKMDYNKVFTDFANHILSRLSLAENAVPSTGNQALHRLANPTMAKMAAQSVSSASSQSRLLMSAPRRTRTPTTARRVLNPHLQASLSSHDASASPALRAPPSAMKKANALKAGNAQSVKWADVLSPPGKRAAVKPAKDEVATTLFADEDAHYREPYSLNQMMDQGELQAVSVIAKQDEIHQLEQQAARHRNKIVEMDEIERQLELEIQKLQEEDCIPSPPQISGDLPGKENPSCGEVESPRTPASPTLSAAQHTPQLAPNEGSPLMPPRFSTAGDDFTTRPQIIMDSEAVAMMDRPADLRPEESLRAGALSHSPGSPFMRNVDSGLLKDSVMQSVSVSGSNSNTVDERTGGDLSEVHHQNSQRMFQTAEMAEKPFVEIERDHIARENICPQEGQEPRIHYSTTDDLRMQALMSKNREGIRCDHSTEAMTIQQPSLAIPAAPDFSQNEQASVPSIYSVIPSFSAPQSRANTQVQSANDLSNNLHTPSQGGWSGSIQPVESFRQPVMSTMSTGNCKELNPHFLVGNSTSWLSSTPAHIRTPHAVKSHSMIKELALKHSLPPSNLSRNNPGLVNRDAPPIQTPLAMRTMSMWNRDGELGASPVRFVSPVPLRCGLAAHDESEQCKSTDCNPMHPQSIHVVDPTSATSATTIASTLAGTEATSRMPHQQPSGHKIDFITTNSAVDLQETVSNPFNQQQVATPATTSTSNYIKETKPVGFRPTKPPQPVFLLDLSPACSEADSKQSDDLTRPALHVGGHLRAKAQGSLSLGAELMSSGGAAAFLKSKLKPLLTDSTNQLFQEALLDEECALYACRLPSKFGHIAKDRQCFDPVAKILMDGDDMHFVPVQSKGSVYVSSPIGSAFNMYSNH